MIWVFKALLDYPHLLLLPSPSHLKLPNTAQFLPEFWRTEELWHKITSKLDLERACSCTYLFLAGKSFWSAFSYYLSNDVEIFQAPRFQQPLFFQCSGMSVLMCQNLSSSPPPKVGTKVFQWFFLLSSAVCDCFHVDLYVFIY